MTMSMMCNKEIDQEDFIQNIETYKMFTTKTYQLLHTKIHKSSPDLKCCSSYWP